MYSVCLKCKVKVSKIHLKITRFCEHRINIKFYPMCCKSFTEIQYIK